VVYRVKGECGRGSGEGEGFPVTAKGGRVWGSSGDRKRMRGRGGEGEGEKGKGNRHSATSDGLEGAWSWGAE